MLGAHPATRQPPQRTGARIELRDLRREYGRVEAVRRVSLDVRPGEFLTLLGPSGSGKTTTLRMIAGFVRPTAGEILVNGDPIIDVPPFRRDIGMVFQSYALFPHLSVFDNVAFPLRRRGVPRGECECRVRQALALVHLTDLEARAPRALSGGQQQRVALARALVFEPAVLLMDEPLGALDRKLRERMQLEIKAIQRSLHITTIYVTHDQEEALVLSDRIAVMNHGRIEQLGTPEELYDRPASRFVADFVGATNLLQIVEPVPSAGGARVRTSSGLELPVGGAPGAGRWWLAIRPERITLLGKGETRPVELDGKVEEAVFVGDAVKYRVRVQAETLLVRGPAARGPRPYEPGDTVRVGWATDDATLVPDGDDA